MSKMYVKDEKGKYKLVDKDRDQKVEQEKLDNSPSELSLEELDARLKNVERVVLDPRK